MNDETLFQPMQGKLEVQELLQLYMGSWYTGNKLIVKLLFCVIGK